MYERELVYQDAVWIQEIIRWSANKQIISFNDFNRKRSDKINEADFDFYMSEILKISPAIFTKSNGYGLYFEPTSALEAYAQNNVFINAFAELEQKNATLNQLTDLQIQNLDLHNDQLSKSNKITFKNLAEVTAALISIFK